MKKKILECLESSPVIAVVRKKNFEKALALSAEVIFLLCGDILSIEEKIKAAHDAGKYIFVHIDLTECMG